MARTTGGKAGSGVKNAPAAIEQDAIATPPIAPEDATDTQTDDLPETEGIPTQTEAQETETQIDTLTPDVPDLVTQHKLDSKPEPEPSETLEANLQTASVQEIDQCLNALKTLLNTVEKLQKVRQEVGDIKPLLVKMLDGEGLSGEDLEQLKGGVAGLFRLVRAYSDHQLALTNAQPARTLLDQVLK